MKKKAIIFGITGQDGILLSKLLIKKGYKVIGFYKNKKKKKLIPKNIKLILSKNITRKIIDKEIKLIQPDEIYFLIGQSSSFISFKKPSETLNSNFIIFTYLVESCIKYNKKSKIFYASSAEIFGSNPKKITEETKKNPLNPYALSKYLSMIYIKHMRKYYNLNISIGIFFNHDSKYRSDKNFSKKIINFLNSKIKKKRTLKLGNIDVYRDLGLAEEYVEAIYKINQQKKPDDYIVATGKSFLLRDVVKYAFSIKNLNYINYIKINKKKFKNKEIKNSSANINKIKKKLNWKPKKNIKDLIKTYLN